MTALVVSEGDELSFHLPVSLLRVAGTQAEGFPVHLHKEARDAAAKLLTLPYTKK